MGTGEGPLGARGVFGVWGFFGSLGLGVVAYAYKPDTRCVAGSLLGFGLGGGLEGWELRRMLEGGESVWRIGRRAIVWRLT